MNIFMAVVVNISLSTSTPDGGRYDGFVGGRTETGAVSKNYQIIIILPYFVGFVINELNCERWPTCKAQKDSGSLSQRKKLEKMPI